MVLLGERWQTRQSQVYARFQLSADLEGHSQMQTGLENMNYLLRKIIDSWVKRRNDKLLYWH